MLRSLRRLRNLYGVESLLALILLTCGPELTGRTLVVTSTSDSGPGSLREAILEANESLGLDLIKFSIPGSGPHTIALKSGLPQVTDSVIVDGTLQDGYVDHPVIEIDGSLAGNVNGLLILAGQCIVKALCINRFQQDGIRIESGPGNIIVRCFIGTDPTGRVARGNTGNGIIIFESANNRIGSSDPGHGNLISANGKIGLAVAGLSSTGNVILGNRIGTDATAKSDLGNTLDGIYIYNAPANIVGGTDPNEGNTISGNDQRGIGIVGKSASENRVLGNIVGTDCSGTTALRNGSDGIGIIDSPGNFIGGTVSKAGNLIAGNAGRGIAISGLFAGGNRIQGNSIGTDRSGTQLLGNLLSGIDITNSPQTLIGGPVGGAGNLISGNGESGISLRSGANGSIIQGNMVGTDRDGRVAIGNTFGGIYIYGAGNCRVGGTNPGAGNIVSGNSKVGISIGDAGATNNVVQGNLIGTTADGLSALGNNWHSVEILNTSSDNTIGGEISAAANFIAFAQSAGYDGVRVRDGCTGNRIQGNRIFSNAGLGIDLGPDGVTPNDSGDLDTGGNMRQNVPDLTAAVGNYIVVIRGRLDSTPNNDFDLDFYVSPETDPTGFGQGKLWIGQAMTRTDTLGHADLSVILTNCVVVRGFLSATATDPLGNTSEFSLCVPNKNSTLFDRDGDGLPDEFERAFTLNPMDNTDAGLDADNDGFSNIDEFLCGTNPRDPNDVLKIAMLERSESGVRLGFYTYLSHSYVIQTAEILETDVGNWSSIGSIIPGTGRFAWVWLTTDETTSATRQFYRVKLENQQ